MSSIKTAVGTVDTTELERLEREFDTRRISSASVALTNIACQTDKIEKWCKDLAKLHNMAMYLIKHDDLRIPVGREPIYELANRLSDEISEWQEQLDEACGMLYDLAKLAPEDLEDFEDLNVEGDEPEDGEDDW